MTAVVVVGGGPAGCAAAHALRTLGREVVLLEAGAAVGGRTATLREDGFSIDTGAVFLPANATRTLRLVRALGRGVELVPLGGTAGFHDGERLHLVTPPSYAPLPLLTRRDRVRLGLRALAAGLGSGPKPYERASLERVDRGQTIAQWARARLGPRLYEHVVRPAVEPLGFPAERTSAAVWQSMMRDAVRHPPWRPRQLALASGMGELCDALSARVELRSRVDVLAVRVLPRGVEVVPAEGEPLRARGAIVATDAVTAAELLGHAAPDGLRATAYSASVHVALGYRRNPWPDFPTWAVIPVGEDQRAAVTLLSRKARPLVPEGAEVADVYFSPDASRGLAADDAVAAARGAVDTLIGPPATPPDFVRVFARERALPIPVPGRYAEVRRLLLSLPVRVRLAGDYLSNPGIESAVASGRRAAHELDRALEADSPPVAVPQPAEFDTSFAG